MTKIERVQDKVTPAFYIPDPAFTMEVEGKSMVAIPVEIWERIVEEFEDAAAASRAKAIMADASDPIILLEEGRRELFDNHIKKVRKRKGMTRCSLLRSSASARAGSARLNISTTARRLRPAGGSPRPSG